MQPLRLQQRAANRQIVEKFPLQSFYIGVFWFVDYLTAYSLKNYGGFQIFNLDKYIWVNWNPVIKKSAK
jgi:hypothetical protein